MIGKEVKIFGASVRQPQRESGAPVKYEVPGSVLQFIPKSALGGRENLQFGGKGLRLVLCPFETIHAGSSKQSGSGPPFADRSQM